MTGLEPTLPPFRIVKEKRATFAATPEQDAKRPPRARAGATSSSPAIGSRQGFRPRSRGRSRSGDEAARLVAAARPGASLVAGTALA